MRLRKNFNYENSRTTVALKSNALLAYPLLVHQGSLACKVEERTLSDTIDQMRLPQRTVGSAGYNTFTVSPH